MPITVVVRSGAASDPSLTFDGMQPVVIGRGGSCDVRLPDASVSHRHASLRADGSEFLLTDEGSTNGTFVGEVRIAAHTSRIVRPGDRVRVGRVWLDLRLNQEPATRDLAVATREIALALVSRAMAKEGKATAPCILVAEGPDRGASLSLAEPGRGPISGSGVAPTATSRCVTRTHRESTSAWRRVEARSSRATSARRTGRGSVSPGWHPSATSGGGPRR